jgi:predicted RNA-binding protein YlqC (UPF0109 family)
VKELVETIVRNLVDRPDEVSVTEERGARHLRLLVRVAEDDRGNVIGRGGGTVQAMRTLANSLAQRHRLRVDIDVLD